MSSDIENITLGEFGPGNFVNVIYTAPTDASRIIINLLSDTNSNIHVNPRYDQKALVVTSKTGGAWNDEERPPGFPITPGKSTQVTVAALEKVFDIHANKAEFVYLYKYLHNVTEVNKVQAIGNGTELKTSVGKVLPDYGVGKVVYIRGRPALEATGGYFQINFIPSGLKGYNPQTIAFHISVRIAGDLVIRNTKIDNIWGEEERDGECPFSPGENFNLIVVAQADGFEVAVNGNHFTQFKYRIPLSNEMSVEVQGLPHLEKVEYF